MSSDAARGTRVAIALCVHHKPWLVMATMITMVLQDYQKADVYIIYNLGDGSCPDKAGYRKYRLYASSADVQQRLASGPPISDEQYAKLATGHGINSQLSEFDERVRQVCQLRGTNVVELEYENDHALDSGAWYKFIKSGIWREYDYVLCIQEGTLLTRANTLSSAVEFMKCSKVDFLAAGHIKGRVPRNLFLNYKTRRDGANALDEYHDKMIRAVFAMFSRDQAFRQLFDAWSEEGSATRQHHVPDIWRNRVWRRVRDLAEGRWGLPRQPLKRWIAAWLREHRELFPVVNYQIARARVSWTGISRSPAPGRQSDSEDCIYVDGERRRLKDVVSYTVLDGARFHLEAGHEWFGACCNHMFGRSFLERFSTKLEQHNLYEVLDLPFSGTALEVVWGFLPHWLGLEKWFFDGLHRPNKNFATYRREDEPLIMADYINRYYPGMVAVSRDGDYLKVRGASGSARGRLRAMLDSSYF